MHSASVILSVAALAGTALSQKSDAAFCSSLASSFYGLIIEAPTTPADILSFIATATGLPPLPTTIDASAHQDQLCALATALPSSLLPEFQTLASELLSFGKAHSSEFIEYITDCAPEDVVASSTSYLDYVFTATGNICTETATPGSSASNGTYPTGTGSAYPTATATSSTLILTAAATKPTGVLAGVAAVGGAIGAAALL
ncbi:hypothetical protein GGS24DRAFT_491632 [Hypoxylon argillaceum]|nr:hypothetical protein GGS24DRAFT_491632 [Hypoxylon argillaceum]KAI1149916.1 hypothetical protein F4825DRAFT_428774 [Nemania diffusa]